MNCQISSPQPGGGAVRIGASEAGNHVLVEIEATAPGIPRDIRDRIRTVWTRRQSNRTRARAALSRQTVLNHRGKTWTEPASGARSVIRLPPNRARSSQNVYMLAESSTSRDVSKR
jgi:signal transduction histidine kinase